MTIRPALRALTGLAAAAALAVPGAALAQSYSHTDPSHDVQKISGSTFTNAPTYTKADVTKVRLVHTAKGVTGSVRLRALGKSYDWTLVSEIKTPGKKFDVAVVHRGNKTRVGLSKHGGAAVKCAGIDGAFKTSKKTVAYAVPASCLGKPKWVQVGIGFAVPVSGAVYGDDGLTKAQAQGADLAFSKRLFK